VTVPVANARQAAESLMTATCTIRQRGTGTTTDPDTGEVTPVAGSVVYSGKCRIKPGGGVDPGGAREIGGGEAFTYDLEVWIPFSAPRITGGALLTVDTSPDPWAVGVTAEVARAERGDFNNRHTLYCREAVA
jgi:hypothetical protein